MMLCDYIRRLDLLNMFASCARAKWYPAMPLAVHSSLTTAIRGGVDTKTTMQWIFILHFCFVLCSILFIGELDLPFDTIDVQVHASSECLEK